MTWQPIETAQDGDRVLVCGWQKPTRGCAGYYWWHEDCVWGGKGTEHPDALYWTPLTLPDFPPPPEATP